MRVRPFRNGFPRARLVRARTCVGAIGGACAMAAVLVVASGGLAGAASTSNTTVSVTVASATTLNAGGCASNTPNVTMFGTLLPSDSAVTSADCVVVFGSSNDTAMLKAYQGDLAGKAMFRPNTGTLDTAFDTDGKAVTNLGNTLDIAVGVVVQSDGAIVACGRTAPSLWQYGAARYLPSGALDATFDGDGKAFVNFTGVNAQCKGIALQADGKVVMAGYAQNATYDFSAARLTTAGALDTTFDTDGKVVTAIGANNDGGNALAIQPDGKIVVAGYSSNGANNDVGLARYNSDGSLDTTFDTDGKVTTPVGGASIEQATAVAIQADGRIVASGYTNNGGTDDFLVIRYTSTGSLDTSFDGDGMAITPVLAGADQADSLVIQPDGKILVMGSAGSQAIGVRYNTDGTLDTTFDTDGKVAIPGTRYANGVALLSDGRIMFFGAVGTPTDMQIGRLNANGSLDTTFDSDGLFTPGFGADLDGANAGAIGQDGRIVAAGYYYTGSTDYDFSVAVFDTSTIEDYSNLGGGGDTDWSGGTNMFGACLRSTSGAGVVGTWTVDGNATCTTADSDPWYAIATSYGGGSAKIAASTTQGTTNATANLRFGVRLSSSQRSGDYYAPMVFEVTAPNA